MEIRGKNSPPLSARFREKGGMGPLSIFSTTFSVPPPGSNHSGVGQSGGWWQWIYFNGKNKMLPNPGKNFKFFGGNPRFLGVPPPRAKTGEIFLGFKNPPSPQKNPQNGAPGASPRGKRGKLFLKQQKGEKVFSHTLGPFFLVGALVAPPFRRGVLPGSLNHSLKKPEGFPRVAKKKFRSCNKGSVIKYLLVQPPPFGAFFSPGGFPPGIFENGGFSCGLWWPD